MAQKLIKIGINGFGRIGRSFFRVAHTVPNLEVVAINELTSIENIAHLLKYDSVHGRFAADIRVEGEVLLVNGTKIQVSHHKEIPHINWNKAEVDLVLEATGLFKTKEELSAHLYEANRKVLVSAPAHDDIKMIVLGANDALLKADDLIVSNASCTTNSVAPLLDIVHALCEVEHAFITTVHSYTTDQRLQDGPHKDFRRGRAAAESIVPTTTGAAKAITKIFPHFKGKIGGAGIRVPVPDGSLTDITFTVKNTVTVDTLNQAFHQASKYGKYAGILGYTSDPIVSRDVLGEPYSCLFDMRLSAVLGKMVKVVGWYDNEIGYSNRLADLIIKWYKL